MLKNNKNVFASMLVKKLKKDKILFQQVLKNKQSYLHKDVEDNIIKVIEFILEKGIHRYKYSHKYKYLIFSLNPNDYTPNEKSSNYNSKFNLTRLYGFSYCDIKSAFKILDYYNIIKINKGFRFWLYEGEINGKNLWDYKDPQLTRVYISPPEEWINIDEIDSLDIIKLFIYEIDPERPLAVIKNNQKEIEVVLTPQQEKSLYRVNKFLEKNNLSEFLYQRNYKYEKDIKSYGRIFSAFQNIKKESRIRLLKKKNLKEFDFKSCLANIIHYLETGKLYKGDIYNDFMLYLGISPSDFLFYRDVFKEIFIILLNCPKPKCKQILYLICNKYNFKNQYNLYPTKIIDTFQKHFPIFDKYIFTKSSALTQFLESEICLKILNILIDDNILPLSCHDSFYFPLEDYNYYVNLSYDIFFNVINDYKNSLINNIFERERGKQNISIFIEWLSFSLIFNNNIIMKIENSFEQYRMAFDFT